MSDWEPFEGGRGLVGGRGEERAKRREHPALVHPLVLSPYDTPEHLEQGRDFFAADGPPIEVEVGYGRGHHARDRMLQAAEHRFLLFEIRRQWVHRMVKWLDLEKLDRARVIHEDARPLLMKILPAARVHAFSVFFPDPWWKKKHHKRRVMSPDMIEVIHRLLEPTGRLHFRTDVHNHFELVEQLIAEHGGFQRIDPDRAADGAVLPKTHREKKCAEYDQPVYTLCAMKRSG